MPEPDSAVTRTKQPNSRHCFVCGIENPVGLHLKFYETKAGEVTAEITVPEQYQGYPGVVHGGIVASMLDEITGRAAMEGDAWRFMVTAKLDLRYRSPVPIAQTLILVGRLVNRRGAAGHRPWGDPSVGWKDLRRSRCPPGRHFGDAGWFQGNGRLGLEGLSGLSCSP